MTSWCVTNSREPYHARGTRRGQARMTCLDPASQSAACCDTHLMTTQVASSTCVGHMRVESAHALMVFVSQQGASMACSNDLQDDAWETGRINLRAAGAQSRNRTLACSGRCFLDPQRGAFALQAVNVRCAVQLTLMLGMCQSRTRPYTTQDVH